MKKKLSVRVILVILCLLWLFLIFSFSGAEADASSKMSGGITVLVQKIFYSDWSGLPEADYHAKLNMLSFLVRKIAHFTEYLILGALLSGITLTFEIGKKFFRKAFLFSWLFGTFYAGTDEFHQYFVAGRSAAVFDVMIDSAGVFFGCLLTLGLAAMILVQQKYSNQKNIQQNV